MNSEDKWDKIIDSKSSFISFNLLEIIKYKDLIYLLVKRDFVTYYKQTILGPIWVWLVIKEQPSIETLIGGIVIISTIATHSFLKLKNS